ncbi:uncharacterized protein FTOL_11178 [Fusarium torulosum]|uniref:Uncharacterized protein n=1 Tax=Fusarium torulosum TaxID=33205 RepID=A0AAE8MJG5_9HYPO|nr:uncharacterized protein FTOL_11178 [Fusarium torulosum]
MRVLKPLTATLRRWAIIKNPDCVKADADDGYLPDTHVVAQPNIGIAANR